MPTDVIDFLLKARHVSIGGVALLLVALLIAGKRVDYEQSIRSFFAESDPDIIDYTRASNAFGDDNFVFVTYDDPALLTPAGMDRVAELARELGPSQIDGVARVESIDAMPLLWTIDDGLIAMDALPTFLRKRRPAQDEGRDQKRQPGRRKSPGSRWVRSIGRCPGVWPISRLD